MLKANNINSNNNNNCGKYRYNKNTARQGNNIARNEAILNGGSQTKHPLSTYTDDEKRWLVTTAGEGQSKGTGFILRLKWRWDSVLRKTTHQSKT